MMEQVSFDSMLEELNSSKDFSIPVALGRTFDGVIAVIDLKKCPNLLISGNQETGKTILLDSIICSIMKTRAPEDVMLALIDLKGVEFPVYNGIPHLMTPVITRPAEAIRFFDDLVLEVERRISLFNEARARKIEEYNQMIETRKNPGEKLQYIVVIVDEFSPLILEYGKRFEALIKRITSVARFCGIHLVLSTNRSSADVITGVIKSNLPSQIAFAVSCGINSRIILDQLGAENLLERGEMLCKIAGSRQVIKVQGAYIEDIRAYL